MAADLKSYIQRLRARLDLDAAVADDIVREMETHIEDRLAELQRGGIDSDHAQRSLSERLGRPTALAREFQQAYASATWNDALTAAAAFLFVAALYATHLWNHPAAVSGVAVVVVAATLYGLWRRRPPWFYAWAGLAFTLLSFCGYFAFALLQRASQPIADGQFEPLAMLGVGGTLLYVPLALIIAASCVRAGSRRDWLDASVMLSPSAPVIVWLAALHEHGGIFDGAAEMAVADMALASTFMLMAAAAGLFVRLRSRPQKLATLIGAATVTLATITAVYDPGVSLNALTARTVLLFGFLLSPALLDALPLRPFGPTAHQD